MTPERRNNGVKSRVPWDSEPRISVLPRASSNLTVSQWPVAQGLTTRVREIIVGSSYQKTTSEYTENFMCAAVTVIWRACRSVKRLQPPVVTSYTRSINPITNPNPVSSH
jgi:hypothetical protein